MREVCCKHSYLTGGATWWQRTKCPYGKSASECCSENQGLIYYWTTLEAVDQPCRMIGAGIRVTCTCQCQRSRGTIDIETLCSTGLGEECCRRTCKDEGPHGGVGRPIPGNLEQCILKNWKVSDAASDDDIADLCDTPWQQLSGFDCFACCLKEKQTWMLIGAGLDYPLIRRPHAKGIALDPRIPAESVGTQIGKYCKKNWRPLWKVPGLTRCDWQNLFRGLGRPHQGLIIGAGCGALAAQGYCSYKCYGA